jgi:dTDP-4-dehydrorhamnose reductase
MAAERPCAIVNAAAVGSVDEAERNSERALALNRDGAARLAAAAAHAGIPFLHISTDFVFDGSKRTPYVEEDPAAPANIYGRSKLAGEQAVLAAHPSALVLRTAWVYGRHDTNFLTTMLRRAETQDVVRVVADQYGSPTAGAELARALLDIAARRATGPNEATGIYHLAGAGETSWRGLAEAILARLGAARASRAAGRADSDGRVAKPYATSVLLGARLPQGRVRFRHQVAVLGGVGGSLPRRHPPNRDGDLVMAARTGRSRQSVISRFRSCLPRPAGADMTRAPDAHFSGA